MPFKQTNKQKKTCDRPVLNMTRSRVKRREVRKYYISFISDGIE